MLTRDDVLRRDDRRRKTVTVPAWEGAVLIRELGLDDKAACWAALGGHKDDEKTQAERNADYNVELIRRGCIQDDGSLFFTPADDGFLRRQPDSVLALLVKEIETLSNPSKDDVDNAEKN